MITAVQILLLLKQQDRQGLCVGNCQSRMTRNPPHGLASNAPCEPAAYIQAEPLSDLTGRPCSHHPTASETWACPHAHDFWQSLWCVAGNMLLHGMQHDTQIEPKNLQHGCGLCRVLGKPYLSWMSV